MIGMTMIGTFKFLIKIPRRRQKKSQSTTRTKTVTGSPGMRKNHGMKMPGTTTPGVTLRRNMRLLTPMVQRPIMAERQARKASLGINRHQALNVEMAAQDVAANYIPPVSAQ